MSSFQQIYKTYKEIGKYKEAQMLGLIKQRLKSAFKNMFKELKPCLKTKMWKVFHQVENKNR